jgi:hypothetical protein
MHDQTVIRIGRILSHRIKASVFNAKQATNCIAPFDPGRNLTYGFNQACPKMPGSVAPWRHAASAW